MIPGSEFVELDRGGHYASETNTQAFDDAVLSFIDRHP
jgi:pimeloyl-ACP methyl ester carboxylesterase